MTYDEKIQKIVDYIKSGEKSETNFKVGFEAEHFTVDKDSLDTTRYKQKAGVSDLLEEVKELGYEPSYENGNIMGLRRDGNSISIEPAAQFELAFDAASSIDELFENYMQTMEDIIPIFEKENKLLLQVGYQPKEKIDDIEMIPKQRYKYMYDYFEEFGGALAHNMMKGSCSLQVAIDYKDEYDFRKKYFVANAISPFLYSIFDNAYIFEGKVYDKHNLRQTIWEQCDKDRTGIYSFSFDDDLSYETYAKKILKTPSIFIERDKKEVFTKDKTFEEVMDQDSSTDMIYHALSIVFPDVRVKKYIEVRMPDNIPYPYNFAAIALIKNIFYDEDVLDYVYEKFSDMTYESVQDLKKIATIQGIQALYKEKRIYEWMLDIIDKIEEDRKYIDPLIVLLEKQITPRDIYENLYKESPQKAAYEFSVNKFIKDINGEN
ncbi:MAG: glutamate-cysteine ligase family protein [Anaerococcus sp.]|uniref:glutamate-cysteine ligase family protein n=1 Tax=Anaerococcus sp. TaxID=1872515 RepID=UPI00290297E4|nr:glutamate-cysteine ligase family protein [Anaerococcus sp.]MDU2353099.1 glutamate-cysteine ligase family protein [Anaerococcus sp.]